MFDLRDLESEELTNMDQAFTVFGHTLVFPVHVEEEIRNKQFVSKYVYIGNKRIGHVEVADGTWNVMEVVRSAIIPFQTLNDAIIYILKEEGYL